MSSALPASANMYLRQRPRGCPDAWCLLVNLCASRRHIG
uniref:Uncharacterized protein n=1 Tax=Arundo donax TaxID=35708 RepID=A0A0A8YAM2_ARUDO